MNSDWRVYMANSLEEALRETILDFEYDLNSPILSFLAYTILLHLQKMETYPESTSAFPIMRDYILQKGCKEVLKEIPSKVPEHPSDEELRKYATFFCQNIVAKKDEARKK